MKPPSLTSRVPTPSGLYSTEVLLGGWTATDPLSYAQTLDARTFRDAVVDGLRVPRTGEVARERALHDYTITRALTERIGERCVVAFMGGHGLDRSGDTASPYALVAEIAWRLAALDFLVVSGGGPGAMEAAHLGARMAGRSGDDLAAALQVISSCPTFPHYTQNELLPPDGTFDEQTLTRVHAWQVPAFEVAGRWSEGGEIRSIGVPTWLYGQEPPTPLASAHAKYFENSIREDGLLAIAEAGVVYAEGSAGTLQEVFQDAAQNYYSSVGGTRSPMVFLDIDEFWSVRRPVRLLLEGLFDDETEKLLHFVVTADDAVAAITGQSVVH